MTCAISISQLVRLRDITESAPSRGLLECGKVPQMVFRVGDAARTAGLTFSFLPVKVL